MGCAPSTINGNGNASKVGAASASTPDNGGEGSQLEKEFSNTLNPEVGSSSSSSQRIVNTSTSSGGGGGGGPTATGVAGSSPHRRPVGSGGAADGGFAGKMSPTTMLPSDASSGGVHTNTSDMPNSPKGSGSPQQQHQHGHRHPSSGSTHVYTMEPTPTITTAGGGGLTGTPQSSSSGGGGGAADPRREEDLSDISEDESNTSSLHPVSHKDSDRNLIGAANLQQERDAIVPSIEEEFFEYDDVKVLKDEMRSKMWRLAGRKPAIGGGAATAPPGFNGADGTPITGGGPSNIPVRNRRESGAPKPRNKFVFADFTVDEIDAVDALSLPHTPTSLQPLQQRGGGATAAVMTAATTQHEQQHATAQPPAHPHQTQQVQQQQQASAETTASSAAAAAAGSTTAPPAVAGVSESGSPTALTMPHAVDTVASRHQKLLEESQRPQRKRNADYAEIKRFDVRSLLGHASRVKCIAIAPGEREFVSCSNEDASVTLNSVQTGKEIGIFTGHQDTVINATFSHDGKYLATTSRDHTMILWDVVTAKQLLTFDHAKVVICCCFSKDSRYVATGCQDKVCRLWETRKGRECLIFAQHEGIIIAMSYAPDNAHIVSASADKTLRVWSTTTAKCRFLLSGHQGIVLACHHTNDGRYIVSNDEKLVKVWSTADGSCTMTLNVDEVSNRLHHTPVGAKKLTWTLSCAAPGEFCHYFLVACNNRFVYLLDVTTGEEVCSVFCKAPVYCLASGYTNKVAFGDSFGNVYLLHMQ